MPPNYDLTVRIPHQLPQDEAVRRIRSGIETLQSRYGDRLAKVEAQWTGPHMEGSVTAMQRAITGTVDVEPGTVIVTIRLPFMLALLKDKILTFVQANGEKILRLR